MIDNGIKEQIRNRYKGGDMRTREVIAALPTENIFDNTVEKRVAIYVRVSTDDPRQTTSYELQRNYYEGFVSRQKNWTLVRIYADEGISGTSLRHRKEFLQMIEDSKAGKIDLIVTKSVSRFARNVVDCIGYIRDLQALSPPVGVFFENEYVYTLNDNMEMALTFQSTIAQEESHIKSKSMNASIEMRFSSGILLTPPLLGYDHDEDGNLVINEEEAKTVRLAFFMYLYGYSTQQIAVTLTKLGRKTKKENSRWTTSSILQILQNERHCGDVLARKTWTPNYLNHKSKKNKMNKPQYKWRDHHEAIISRDDFFAVQRLISNAKYGNKEILPKLHVMESGMLMGFVSINPRWAAFSADDYYAASASVGEQPEQPEATKIEVHSGDLDLRGFEVARSQYFTSAGKMCVTLCNDHIQFSTACVRRFDKAMYVELLIHPVKKLLVARPCTKDTRNAVRWACTNDGISSSRNFTGAAYIGTLFEILGWDKNYKYRVRGFCKQCDDGTAAIFDMQDTEVFIPSDVYSAERQQSADKDSSHKDCSVLTDTRSQSVLAFPISFLDGFGSDFYVNANNQPFKSNMQEGKTTLVDSIAQFSVGDELNVTNAAVLGNSIKQILTDMKQEAPSDEALLNLNGYSVGTPDGLFGTGSENKLKQFQTAHGLTVDGICGAQTWEALCEI